jgi:hypothetical protein
MAKTKALNGFGLNPPPVSQDRTQGQVGMGTDDLRAEPEVTARPLVFETTELPTSAWEEFSSRRTARRT